MNPREHPSHGPWCVVSVNQGKKHSERRVSRHSAMRTMLHHLKKGRPAWLVHDPSYFDDDDIPF